MAARFLEISGVAILKLAEKAVNKNKFKSSKTWMNDWKLWAENKSLNADIVKYVSERAGRMSLALLCRHSQKLWLPL